MQNSAFFAPKSANLKSVQTIDEYVIEFTTIVKEAGEPPEVRQENAKWIAPTNDERLTLVTCWPYPRSTHRLIVVARPK